MKKCLENLCPPTNIGLMIFFHALYLWVKIFVNGIFCHQPPKYLPTANFSLIYVFFSNSKPMVNMTRIGHNPIVKN